MERWWGRLDLRDDESGRLRVGPTQLWLQNLSDEWRIGRIEDGGPFDSEVSRELPCSPLEWSRCADVSRFAAPQSSDSLTLVPTLPDRPVITSAEHPLAILPGDQATIYVSVPLWIRITEEHGATLAEFPLFRPSDTWFGPTTMEGELCYASRMPYRTILANVPIWPHRVTTEISVKNSSAAPLRIDRVRLPVTHLSLFFDSRSGRFTTEPVAFKQLGISDVVELRIARRGSKGMSADMELLSPARERVEDNLAVRAFESLFGALPAPWRQ